MKPATVSKLSILVLSTFAIPSLAGADGTRAERLHALGQKLATIESQLNPDDMRALDHKIGGIEQILSRFQATAAQLSLTCLSNGQSGAYEKFALTDPATGTAFGKPSSLPTCKELSTVQNQSLVCVSNGESSNYEKFGVYDLGRKQQKGGFTGLKNCLSLVTRARGNFVCQSNGQAGNYEKFRLYNRETDKVLGGETLLDQCLGSIPN